MLALVVVFVVLLPVTADGQTLHAAFFDRNDVRQGNTSGFAVVICVLEAFEVQVDVDFQQFVAIIGRGAEAHLLGDLFLYVIERIVGFAQLNISVETRHLQFAHVVFGFTHHMGHAFGCFDVRCAVWHHDIVGLYVD